MSVDRELRGFLARLLGWRTEHAVDQALASIELATARRAHLVLCGIGNLVPIAHALHCRTLGPERPFIVCDPHWGNTPASVRLPANRESAAEAIFDAVGLRSDLRAGILTGFIVVGREPLGPGEPCGEMRAGVANGIESDVLERIRSMERLLVVLQPTEDSLRWCGLWSLIGSSGSRPSTSFFRRAIAAASSKRCSHFSMFVNSIASNS